MRATEVELRSNATGETLSVVKGRKAQAAYRRYGKVAPFQCVPTDAGLCYTGAYHGEIIILIYFGHEA